MLSNLHDTLHTSGLPFELRPGRARPARGCNIYLDPDRCVLHGTGCLDPCGCPRQLLVHPPG